MKTIKVDIIGSCVTRDAFEFAKEIDIKNKYIINNYISKTSVISLLSKKLEYNTYSIDNRKITDWESRQITYDLEKNWIDILLESDSDIIILDLIDERYDLYKIEETYITKSNILNKSRFKTSTKAQKIKRNSKECEKLWSEYLDKYINKLKKLDKKIIVHKAMWKDYYLNSNVNKSVNNNIYFKNILYGIYYGNIWGKKNDRIKFKRSIINKIESNNRILEKYYNSLTQAGNFKMIDIDKYNNADKGHKWGLAPFHYESSYYKAFIIELEKIINMEEREI